MAEQWHYTCEGKQIGPVSATEIKQLAMSGLLKPTDMVWKEGMPDLDQGQLRTGMFRTRA